MAYNNGGGSGRALDPELQAQLDEAKAMSASFTRAGNKAHPGRGRAGGGSRSSPFQPGSHRPPASQGNRGSHFSSAPLRPPATIVNQGPRPNVQSARFGGTGSGAGSHSIINPPAFKAASPSKAASNARIDGFKSPSKVVVNTAFEGGNSSSHLSIIRPSFVGSLNSVAPGDPHTGFKAPVLKVTTLSNTTSEESRAHIAKNATSASDSNGQNARQAPPVASTDGRELIVTNWEGLVEKRLSTPASISQHHQAAPVASMAGRQLIVTNWTEDVDKKPWIPAHLQQTSAFQAIQEIAVMINQPVEAITMDGCSIPRPRPGARPLIAPFYPPAIVPAPRQPDVDPAAWFTAAKPNANIETNVSGFAGQFNLQEQPQDVSDSAMDIDMNEGDSGSSQLGGDRTWSAPATHAAAVPRVTHVTPAAYTVPTVTPSVTTSRAQDLSGSIWADDPWKLPNKKENERSLTSKFGSRQKPPGFVNQPTTIPVNSSSANHSFNIGTSGAPSFATNSGSSSTLQISAPESTPVNKIKNLNDSMWA